METFSALLAFCAGNSPITGEFPSQRPVTRSFDVFFDLRQCKQLSKQSRGWCLRRNRTHYGVIVMHLNLSSVTNISWEHRDFISIIDVQSIVGVNDRVHYGMRVVFVCLHTTHYHISIIMQTYLKAFTSEMLVMYIVSRVCLRLSQFSQLSFIK